MANDWFNFKQFSIRQDKTPMKVGTDGVLLGAWVDCSRARRVIDVGTGTGLIALMLAQRFPGVVVDAIELDPDACSQADENFKASPWPSWINLIKEDFIAWSQQQSPAWDHVVCNPPFFKNSLHSDEEGRNRARHDTNLPLDELVKGAARVLLPQGSLSIIMPVDRLPDISRVCLQSGFHLNRIMRIRGTIEAPPKRVLLRLDRVQAQVEMADLVIETGGRHGYSAEYLELTRDFYLFA